MLNSNEIIQTYIKRLSAIHNNFAKPNLADHNQCKWLQPLTQKHQQDLLEFENWKQEGNEMSVSWTCSTKNGCKYFIEQK